mmetsp:Transcript_22438/g.29087  ORF Transcript_22438/g.29087 Transcript_22438/m.29087 type:complete len:211 (+) Transcript_22438:749-1381(+)
MSAATFATSFFSQARSKTRISAPASFGTLAFGFRRASIRAKVSSTSTSSFFSSPCSCVSAIKSFCSTSIGSGSTLRLVFFSGEVGFTVFLFLGTVASFVGSRPRRAIAIAEAAFISIPGVGSTGLLLTSFFLSIIGFFSCTTFFSCKFVDSTCFFSSTAGFAFFVGGGLVCLIGTLVLGTLFLVAGGRPAFFVSAPRRCLPRSCCSLALF